MDRVIYTSMTGATAAVQRQQVVSNNLANVNTHGFKAELATFRSVSLRGEGATTRAFALEATAGHLDKPGSMVETGRNLDLAGVGEALFALQGLEGGEVYTRTGSLQVSDDGQLVGYMGLPVLDDGGAPINVPEGAAVTVSADGNVSVRVGEQPVQIVGRLKIVTPNDDDRRIYRGNDGLYRGIDDGPLPADPAGRLKPGMLESSNVNAVESMVNMISAARQYELQMRMISNAEKNDQTASQLLGLNG